MDLPYGTVSFLRKGPSFVPTQKFVDWGKLSKDFIKFKNKLRGCSRYGDTGDDPAYDNEEDLIVLNCPRVKTSLEVVTKH